MLQNNQKARVLQSRNLSFLLFFRCQSELSHRSKSKKASLSASFLIVLAESEGPHNPQFTHPIKTP